MEDFNLNVTTSSDELVEEYCNLCGERLDFYDMTNDFHLTEFPGYGSIHDGEMIHLNLCCKCFDKLVDGCKISPVEEF